MSEKEPGQMAYEAFCSREGMACAPWSSLFPGSKELWAAVESAIRADEAAKSQRTFAEKEKKLADVVEEAFHEGFQEGKDGSWVVGSDYVWKRSDVLARMNKLTKEE